jgi:hypothetical protein
MKMRAEHSHRRGDAIVGESGRRFGAYPSGVWLVGSGISGRKMLEDHLEYFAELLEAKSKAMGELYARGVRADLYCVVYGDTGSTGISLPAELMRRLGGLGVEVGVTLERVASPIQSIAKRRREAALQEIGARIVRREAELGGQKSHSRRYP